VGRDHPAGALCPVFDRSLPVERIGVIKPSALGDVVQAMPLLGVLRHRFPTAELFWVINRDLADILADHPSGVHPVPFDRRGSLWQQARLLYRLRNLRLDLVLDLQGLARSAVMLLATGATHRIGLETAREGADWACTQLLPNTRRSVAAWQRYWRVAEALELGGLPRDAGVTIDRRDTDWAESLLNRLPGPRLVVHPGARWITKRWAADRFGEIGRRFVQATGGSVLTIGSTGEAGLAATVTQAARSAGRGAAINLAGRTSLKQLAAVFQRCDLVLSNDSGPMHLAAAMHAPVVGIFTCTSPILSGPGVYRRVASNSPTVATPDGGLSGSEPGHELVSTSVWCAASYCKTCPQMGMQHMACLHDVSIDRVWRAVLRVLERTQPNSATA
jgi:ADP-heptose:LPS heptosyltransferase